jgi:hypothetical protein
MKGPFRELNGVLALVLRREWERDNLAFLGTTFGFRREDRCLTAAHCIDGIPARDLLIVDLDEPMEVIRVDEVAYHPTADVAVLITERRERPTHEFYCDTHGQFMPGEEFTAFGYPSELSGRTPDFPVGRLFRGHFQRFFMQETLYLNPRTQTPYRFVAGEMSMGAPRGLNGGVVFSREPQYALGIVTGNMETYTERRQVVDERTGDQHVHLVESHIINYGVALLLSRVIGFLDEYVPK